MKKIISAEIVYENNVDSNACYISRPYMVRTTILKTVTEYKYFWMRCPKRDIIFTIDQNAPRSKSSLLASTDYNEAVNSVANEEMFVAETWLYNNYRNLIAGDIGDKDYNLKIK